MIVTTTDDKDDHADDLGSPHAMTWISPAMIRASPHAVAQKQKRVPPNSCGASRKIWEKKNFNENRNEVLIEELSWALDSLKESLHETKQKMDQLTKENTLTKKLQECAMKDVKGAEWLKEDQETQEEGS